MVNSFLLHALKSLFPQYCLLCGLRSSRDIPLCAPCEAELPANHSCCSRCALPLPDAAASITPSISPFSMPLSLTSSIKTAAKPPGAARRLCGQCLSSPPPFASATVPWLYSDQLAYIIRRWKYGREWRLTALLAYLWLQHSDRAPDVDLVVPVPLHWQKRWRRGANQAELLCRQVLSSPTGASPDMDTSLVHRHRATHAQSHLGATERRQNLGNAFTVHGRCDNLTIAVVDDVLTTGATAAAITDALLCAGARRVDIWCLARTPPPVTNAGLAPDTG